MSLTFGSLFTGIGGMDLGLERAGMVCKWQSEIDEKARQVLAHHWPGIPNIGDVKNVGRDTVEPVDVICGGFPCQDVSIVGPRVGLSGGRSGLWSEFVRIIREIEPGWVVVENVRNLLSIDNGRGFGTVLRDLAESGYDAEWQVLPAAAFGSPMLRERVFIVAYTAGLGRGNVLSAEIVNDRGRNRQAWKNAKAVILAYQKPGEYEGDPENIRVGYGVPGWVDRLRELGNAVVPQVVEFIGRAILEVHNA